MAERLVDRARLFSRLSRRGFLATGLGTVGVVVAACGRSAPSSPAPSSGTSAIAPAAAATPPPAATSPPAATVVAASPTAQVVAVANATAAPAATSQASTSGAGNAFTWIVYANTLQDKWETTYAIPEYKKVHPEVTINRIQLPYAQFNTKIFALQAAGETPNLFGFDIFATWWARGLAYPIDDYLKTDPGLEGQFFQNMFETYHWQGKKWGLPMAPRFGNMTFYNKDLFDQAGVPYPKIDFTMKDWNADVMLEKATKLTKNYGKPEVTFGIDLNPWSPHGLAYLWGGDTYPQSMYDNGIADHTTVDSEASQAGHQFKLDLIRTHKVSPSASDNKAISILGDPFKTGRLAMTVTGGWSWGSFSDIKAFKWAAAPVPGKTSVKNSENLNIWMLGNNPKGRDASWEFMKFITTADAMRQWVQITGAQPARPDVLDDWIKLHSSHMPAEDIKTLITENIKHTVESVDHMIVDFYRFDDAYTQGVSTLWDGKVDVKTFLTQLRSTWDTTAKDIFNQYNGKIHAG